MRLGMKEIVKISGRKRTKQYVEVCKICGAQYIATRKGSSVCSNVCRAQKSRDKHVNQFKTQTKIIEVQAKVITEQSKELASKGRNCYFGIINGRMVKIKSPEGTDIAKLLDIGRGTENVLKQISLLPDLEKNIYEIKYS
jgi:hypothetical protein